jgi:hypothetical protein
VKHEQTSLKHDKQDLEPEDSTPADPVSAVAGSDGDGSPCERAAPAPAPAPASEDSPEVHSESRRVLALATEDSGSPVEPTRVPALESGLPPLPSFVLPAGASGIVIMSISETWRSSFGGAAVWSRLSAPEALLACV